MAGMPGGFNFMGPGGHMDASGMQQPIHPGAHAMGAHPMHPSMMAAGMPMNGGLAGPGGMPPGGGSAGGGVPSGRTSDSEELRGDAAIGGGAQTWGQEQKPRAD